jgi:hypothetical protein
VRTSTGDDEVADRIAEERSESEGMPEHRDKADDPMQWAAGRSRRIRSYQPLPSVPHHRYRALSLAVISLGLFAVVPACLALHWMHKNRGAS